MGPVIIILSDKPIACYTVKSIAANILTKRSFWDLSGGGGGPMGRVQPLTGLPTLWTSSRATKLSHKAKMRCFVSEVITSGRLEAEVKPNNARLGLCCNILPRSQQNSSSCHLLAINHVL